MTGEILELSNGAIEYRFPVNTASIPREPESNMLRALVGTGGINSLEWFERYYRPTAKPVVRLVESVSKFTPSAIVDYGENWYVRCCVNDVSDYSAGHNLYLPPRLNFTVLRDTMDDFDFHHGTYVDFLRLFCGMREALPPACGHFLYDEFTVFCDAPWADSLDMDADEEWVDSLCLFRSRNGDILLMNEEGETGWFLHEQGRVEPYSTTFNKFVLQYAAFLDKCREPFDGYSAFTVHY